jgi:RHS repeat-associated protein
MKRILLLLLFVAVSQTLTAQYSAKVFDLKKASDLYDERGFLQNKALAVDGRLLVSNSNGNVSYSYPVSHHMEGGYAIDVSLNYCGSVAFTAFKDYNLAHKGDGSLYNGWAKFHRNMPAFVLGVNGFAINVIATSSHFHLDSASRAFNSLVNDYNDKDFLWNIDGYDFNNRMSDFDPVGPAQEGGYVDVIRLLRADGSVLDLLNTHSRQAEDTTADKRVSLYTGYYHANEANARGFGFVRYDTTYWPEYILDSVRTRSDGDGFRAALVPRTLHYYPGDGLEYIFKEWVCPFGLSAYCDIESRSGGIWGGPTIFYLEQIRSNAGIVADFYRTRQYPVIGNPLFEGRNDLTRGRALITSFAGHTISFGYNSLIIEALGRTTKVKFDTILRSGNATNWETFPFANNGGMTPAGLQLASYAEGNPQLYKSFVGYVTQIIDPENRVTSFEYEPTTKIYEDFDFPHADPGLGHQKLTLKGYRLKAVNEPTARYTLRYKPGQFAVISPGVTDQPTLNDVCDSVKKFDTYGTLLTTDAYTFDPVLNIGTVTTDDKLTNLTKITTYHYASYALTNLAPLLPVPRHTFISQVDEVATGGAGGTIMTRTATTYRQGTNIPGVGTNTGYLILPISTGTTVNGFPKTYQKFSYATDTVRRYGGNNTLAGRFGIEVTRKVSQTCRTNNPATVLFTDTAEYQHFPSVDTMLTWIEWRWKKLPSIQNYLLLRDQHDPFVKGKHWEDVMFRPPVGVFQPDTITDLVHIPPLFGAERETWTTTADGVVTGKKNVYAGGIITGNYRELRGNLLSDSIIGEGKRTLPGSVYGYSGGGWQSNLLTDKTNANGAKEEYSYDYSWCRLDSFGIGTCTADTPTGIIVSNDDSTRLHAMAPSAFSWWYQKPVAVRNALRKYDQLGPIADTLTNYYEHSYYGQTSGERDLNGWFSRSEFDQNGRLNTLWLSGDFPRNGALDTITYDGRERAELYGVTYYNRRADTLHCDKINGTVTSEIIEGPERTTLNEDTLYASLPITEKPACPCKDDIVEAKDRGGRQIQGTCNRYLPFNEHAGFKGVYGKLSLPVDAESPLKTAARIDSLYLDLMVSSIDGECVHLEVAVDTFFTRTFLYNCPVGPPNVPRTKDGRGERTVQGDGSSLTPVAGGYLLHVNLKSVAPQLQALGDAMAVTLTIKTVGATAAFVNGTNAEDLRPHLTVVGAFQKVSDRADYTLAYNHNDAALRATVSAKVDDIDHTANLYDNAVVHGASVRRTEATHYFGADSRLLRSEEKIVDHYGSSRVDTLAYAYTGLGGRTRVKDQTGDTMRTNFDALGRAIETVNSDGTQAVIRYSYGVPDSLGVGDQDFYGFVMAKTVINENGTKFAQYTDAFDHVRREVADSNGLRLTTRYTYDLLGRLTTIVNPKGDTTRYTYDDFGRVKYKSNPNFGIISYAYDALGNVRFSQDQLQANNSRFTFNEYDDLNRLTLMGEAFIKDACADYCEDDLYWRCDTNIQTRTRERDILHDKQKQRRRSILGNGNDDLAGRLTNLIDGTTLHTGPDASVLTANRTLLMPPIAPVPFVMQAFKFSLCPLQPNPLLGETTAPVGPFLERPTQFYSLCSQGATLNDFEHTAQHPEFVRMAIAYDTIPDQFGPVWANMPGQWQWDQLAPRGIVRNQRGKEAVVAYRDRGSDPFHYAVMSYDERGRVEALLRFTEGLGFDGVFYTYNAMNQVTSVRVADYMRQYATWYGYDANGRVDSVWSYLTGPGGGLSSFFGIKFPNPPMRPDTADIAYRYTKTGQVDSMRYPPIGVLVNYAYNHRKWLDSMRATKGGSNIFLEVLSYDPTGQITKQVSQHGTAMKQKQLYGYDSVQRLTYWTQGPVNSTIQADTTRYSYDAVGNRTKMEQSWIAQPDTYHPYFGSPGDLLWYRERFDAQGGDTMSGYWYNDNGALTSRSTSYSTQQSSKALRDEEYRYSYRGLMNRSVTRHPEAGNSFEDWYYRYNASGEREQKRLYDMQAGDNAAMYPWVYYQLGGYKEQLAVYHGQQTSSPMCGDTGRRVLMYPTEYLTYGVGGISSIVTRPAGTKEFKIADHLGSTRAILDGNGSPLSSRDYSPSGEALAVAGLDVRKGFIDKEVDRENGLSNNGVRPYDRETGRFVCVDPMWEKFRGWSLYHYSHDNPLTRSDPNGKWDIEVFVSNDRVAHPIGTAIVTDRNGKVVYTFQVRVLGQHRDRMKTDGDTPTGSYDIEDKFTWKSDGSREAYGPNPRLVLTAISGEAKESGRIQIRVHGGRQETDDGKPTGTTDLNSLPATHGCLRAIDAEMVKLKQVTDQLEANDKEEKPGILTVTEEDINLYHPTNNGTQHVAATP